MDEKYTKSFTLVFLGDIRSLRQNPFTTDSPWGRPIASAMGNVMDEADELREQIEAAHISAE